MLYGSEISDFHKCAGITRQFALLSPDCSNVGSYDVSNLTAPVSGLAM